VHELGLAEAGELLGQPSVEQVCSVEDVGADVCVRDR
jgi:hypothetical protein